MEDTPGDDPRLKIQIHSRTTKTTTTLKAGLGIRGQEREGLGGHGQLKRTNIVTTSPRNHGTQLIIQEDHGTLLIIPEDLGILLVIPENHGILLSIPEGQKLPSLPRLILPPKTQNPPQLKYGPASLQGGQNVRNFLKIKLTASNWMITPTSGGMNCSEFKVQRSRYR